MIMIDERKPSPLLLLLNDGARYNLEDNDGTELRNVTDMADISV